LTILKTEKISVDPDCLPKIIKFITDRFPDMRRILNDLQKSCITGKLVLIENDLAAGFAQTIWQNLKKVSAISIRKLLIEGESEFDSDYQLMIKNLFDIIYNDATLRDLPKKKLLLELGEAMYRDNTVVDHEINFFCFLLSAEQILSES
jgi:uncharacterized protein (DUF488 family)